MSAAEKLKQAAPWDRWREYCNRDVLDMIESDDMDRLLNALPQIVAVVEAAEYRRQDGTFDHVRVAAALAALDERLGDVT